jgi:RimJ/RimL family protein N-acetyltransferase
MDCTASVSRSAVLDVLSPLRLRNVAFRHAGDSDAAAIVALRRPAELRGFLPQTGSVEAQREWLRDYEDRFRRGVEHYFIICSHSNENLGAVRVYDIQAGQCEWGSWVVRSGAPPGVALESYLLVNYFIFEQLQLRAVRIRVRKVNQSVAAFHRWMRSRQSGESGDELFFEVDGKWYTALKTRYRRYLLPMLESAPSGDKQT